MKPLKRNSSCFLAILFLSLALLLPVPSQVFAKNSSAADTLKNLSQLIFSGQQSRALEFLQGLKMKKSKDVWEKRLQFLAAILYLKAGDGEKAAGLLKNLQGQYAPLNDYVDFYLGLALRDSGKAREAIPILQKLKGQKLSRYLSSQLERELALAYCKAGDRGNGVDLLNQLIQMESSAAKTYHLRFDRAQCLLDLGQKQEAATHLKNLYLNYPEGDLGDAILQILSKNGISKTLQASEHLERADILLNQKRPDLAALDLEAAQQAYGGGASFALKEKMAETYFKARRYREAATLMADLRAQNPGGFDAKELEKLGQAYARSDQFDSAIATYQELRQGSGSNAAQFDFKIAFLTMDKGDYAAAHSLLEELLEKYPQHPKKSQILWYLAWNHYLLGRYDEALQALERLKSAFPKSDESGRLAYWQARILEKQGKTSEAKTLYQSVAQEEIFSYYGFLSLKRLEKDWDPPSIPKKSWTKDVPRLKVPDLFSMKELEKGGKVEIQRLKELLIVGLWEDFLAELDQITVGEGIGMTFLGSAEATDNGGAESVGAQAHWQQRYPPAYATLVSLFSQTRNFPMALTWGIMREESHFRPDVVSPANAIGLMQIIPPTGAEISRDLGRGGFVPENLYKPAVNIEYGVHYLAKNFLRFDSNLIFTIASYNAGPEAVGRWLKARPHREWDEFVEEIPYAETQNYVRKVLKSFYIYQLMYSS